MSDINALRREAITALGVALQADIDVALWPTDGALEHAQDTTYTYYAALTRFKFALRDLVGA
jgi:hypothetical protein